MNLPIRYSPSGAVIATLGVGAQLRLAELCSPMTGSASVPTVKSVINSDGFLGAAPLIVTLPLPKPDLKYRAELRLDLWNVTTSVGGSVVLYLECSVDGATWSGVVANAHLVQAQLGDSSGENGTAREATVCMPLTLGSALAVVDGSPSIRFRGAARLAGTVDTIQVNSAATSGGDALNGTIHLEVVECLG